MARRTIEPEQLATAERVLAQGGSQRQAARESGLSPDTIKRRFGTGRRRDPHPGAGRRSSSGPTPTSSPEGAPSGRPRGSDPTPSPRHGGTRPPRSAASPTDQQLENMLRKIAKTPALFMALVVRCDFCAGHFRDTAPVVARELVAQAAEDPDLHEMLVWGYRNLYKYAWAGNLAFWAGIPMLHHLAPDFVYNRVAPLTGMPSRSSTPGHSRHEHSPVSGAPPSTNGAEPPPATPTAQAAMAFAGGIPDLSQMDPGQLAAMAHSMGIEISAEELAEFLGTEPGIEPEPGEPAPDVAPGLDDDFIEPEPDDLAVDMLTPDEPTADEEPEPAAGAPSAEATEAPADPGVPDALL